MAGTFVCNLKDTVVQTVKGKLRGFRKDGTYIFQGIKYAEAKRFQMPVEVEPWVGVKDALAYGYVAPLLSQPEPSNELLVPHRYWPESEDCLYLNVWTQHLDKQAKKPVLVWLHGGGFSAGSAIEHDAYDGENMSKRGDVVVVSLNHRLNILGYLDLSPFGGKYRNSANAGNADMVAALKWIRQNIESFGGDPDNVTLFGQSGGGMKVWSLMQTPEADGLFHKGIVQSGVIQNFDGGLKGDGKPIVLALLKELGLKESEVEKLETIPYARLAQAYKKVAPEIRAKGLYVGERPMANGWYLGDPREVGFCEHARTIPVMAGTVFAEFSFGAALEGRSIMAEEEKAKLIKAKYGERAEQLTALFKAAYPGKNLMDLLVVDSLFRAPTMDFVLKKAAHPEAPTYSYLFDFDFPFDEGKPAWHCSEIPFVFGNTSMFPIAWAGDVTKRLEEQMLGAWLQFARTGNPNHAGIPQWDASRADDEAMMIFAETCEVRHNFDHELIRLHEKAAPRFRFGKEKVEH